MAVYLSDESGQLHKVAGNGPNVAPLINGKVDKVSTNGIDTDLVTSTIKNENGKVSVKLVDSDSVDIDGTTIANNGAAIEVGTSISTPEDSHSILQYASETTDTDTTASIIELVPSLLTLRNSATEGNTTVGHSISLQTENGISITSAAQMTEAAIKSEITLSSVLGISGEASSILTPTDKTEFQLSGLAAKITTPTSAINLYNFSNSKGIELSVFNKENKNDKSTFSIEKDGVYFNNKSLLTSSEVDAKLADLKKEILTGGANEEVNTAYDTLLEISKWIQSNEADTSLTEAVAKLQNEKLAKGNDTLTGSITLTGDGKLVLSPSGKGQLTDGTSLVLGFNSATQLDVGNKTYNLALLGKTDRPSYNGSDLALKSDIITSYNSLTDKPSIGNGLITIKQGTVSKSFNLNSNDALTIELTDNNTTYTAGNGLNLTGTSFAVKAGSNITVDTNGVSVTSGAFVTPSSLTTTLGSYVTTSNLNTTLSGYSTTGHKHTTSDITNFGTYVNQTTGTSAVKGKWAYDSATDTWTI